jgi:hypothetical protein
MADVIDIRARRAAPKQGTLDYELEPSERQNLDGLLRAFDRDRVRAPEAADSGAASMSWLSKDWNPVGVRRT